MPWRPLRNPAEVMSDDLKKKTRILVDESLGQAVADYLQQNGYNAVFANDVGLSGRSDEDIFGYAWREKRMLLPGGDGDNRAMEVGVGTALEIFGHWPALWSKTKSTVSPTGEMTIRKRDYETGKVEASRYRMTKRGYAEKWRSE